MEAPYPEVGSENYRVISKYEWRGGQVLRKTRLRVAEEWYTGGGPQRMGTVLSAGWASEQDPRPELSFLQMPTSPSPQLAADCASCQSAPQLLSGHTHWPTQTSSLGLPGGFSYPCLPPTRPSWCPLSLWTLQVSVSLLPTLQSQEAPLRKSDPIIPEPIQGTSRPVAHTEGRAQSPCPAGLCTCQSWRV